MALERAETGLQPIHLLGWPELALLSVTIDWNSATISPAGFALTVWLAGDPDHAWEEQFRHHLLQNFKAGGAGMFDRVSLQTDPRTAINVGPVTTARRMASR